jgi:hypothetical protein
MELSSPLANQYSKGKDEYPMDFTLAYSLLVNYCTPTNAVRQEQHICAEQQSGIIRCKLELGSTTMTFAH